MTGSESDKFCLRWNEFESNLSSAIQEVESEKCLYDVTVACDGGGEFPAHRLVLSACSLVLRQVLCRKSQLGGGLTQHQVVYLRGVTSQDLKFILSFMYQGEVSLAQHQLNSFLAVAEDLQVKGLIQSKNSKEPIKQISPNRPLTQNSQTAVLNNIHSQPIDDIQEIPTPASIKLESNSRRVGQSGPLESFHDSRELVDYDHGGGDNIYDEYSGHYDQHNESYGAGANANNGNKVWNISGSVDPEGLFERRQEGDFICVQCGYTNKWKHNMQKHIEVHIDGPGHECKFCFRNFKTKNSLQSHISMKHREEKHNSL